MAQITEWSRRASVLSGYVNPAHWAELPLDEMQATQCAIFAILTKHGFNTAGLAAIGPVLRGGEVRPGLWRRSIVPLRQAVEEAQANPLARPVFLHLTATPEHNQPGSWQSRGALSLTANLAIPRNGAPRSVTGPTSWERPS
jgi:hypothetical protein